jgi:hypothetical protein
MFNKTSLLSLVSILLLGCGHDSHQHDTTLKDTTVSIEDSLYKAVIRFHDEVMPKMGKLVGYKKVIQAKIDSLNKALANKKDETGHELKTKYEKLLIQLKEAEKGMNNWMDSFEPDPKLPSKQELENYWETEHKKAKKMRDDVKAAIDSAKSELRQ